MKKEHLHLANLNNVINAISLVILQETANYEHDSFTLIKESERMSAFTTN